VRVCLRICMCACMRVRPRWGVCVCVLDSCVHLVCGAAGDIYADPLLMVPGVAGSTNLLPLYDNLNAAIRAVDDTHLVFYEPVTWVRAAVMQQLCCARRAVWCGMRGALSAGCAVPLLG
jgi:hypothetical protein